MSSILPMPGKDLHSTINRAFRTESFSGDAYLIGKKPEALYLKGVMALQTKAYHFVLVTNRGLVRIDNPSQLKADMIAKGFFVANNVDLRSDRRVHQYSIETENGTGSRENMFVRDAFDWLIEDRKKNQSPSFATITKQSEEPRQRFMSKL